MVEEECDLEFDYSDSASEPDVDLENQYYLAKSMLNEDIQTAIIAFEMVLELQGEKLGKWGFKALSRLVRINFELGKYDETMSKYKQLLMYITNAVDKNYGEFVINSILDYTSGANEKMLESFYDSTLNALKTSKNERLWFRTNTKLGHLHLKRNEFFKLIGIIKDLKNSLNKKDEVISSSRGTQLLEIYSLEIQMYTVQKNYKKLKQLYEESLRVQHALPHPLIMSVIRECGGKMHLREAQFQKAYTDFFVAFKHYDEAGNARRLSCLKYLILTSMLMKSDINPFDSQEAKPYGNDPEIRAMATLIDAFQNNRMHEFMQIFEANKETLIADPFIAEHLERLLNVVRGNAILQLIKPYRTIKISFISQELSMAEKDVENLLSYYILDGQIAGKIDQMNMTVEIREVKDVGRYVAYDKLLESLFCVFEAIETKID
ncbi:unnamed protein product [Ceutorhynchus assimilis]|uniref:PCI domain-containing protein n=1 Tax=Ceutorhynchus assimilis TaxID=467358 RepID=A0A9P0GQ91_9CUCU|nr:unnamed protein product [Ceutorhynchus assimilis]